MKPGQSAPDVINRKKLEREIKAQLKELRLREPLLAEHYEKQLLSNNTEIDKELALVIPKDQIKFYPGSIKGPNPEDDPESYEKWFIENQPEVLKDKFGNIVDAAALGYKTKVLRS